ncbi:MAG: Fe-S cluster assembly protein SufB, partial [Bacteroidota bacterium]|nr:Fe-S cluster assembly protein SufB [Bacteroidota bacterium]
MKENQDDILGEVTKGEYKYGFYTDIDIESIPKGLNEDIIRLISRKKNEPDFMLDFRLKAFKKWKTMKMPGWAHLRIPKIDYQDIIYYSVPKKRAQQDNDQEIDPELKSTFDRLGIPLEEQKQLAGVAVDAVMDSISVKTTFRE